MLAVASACSSTRTQQSAERSSTTAYSHSKVKVALIEIRSPKAGQINVETYRGCATRGFVDNAQQKEPGTKAAALGQGVKEGRTTSCEQPKRMRRPVPGLTNDSMLTALGKTKLTEDSETKAHQSPWERRKGFVVAARPDSSTSTAMKAKAVRNSRSR